MSAIDGMAWLDPHWRTLETYVQAGRVPQALLMAGRAGVGKRLLAETFSQRLLCRDPGQYACGQCVSCHLWAAETHPDFLRVEPEEPGKAIPVDAIRKLIATLELKPQYSGRRVVLIVPAHQMNVSSANSLLKTLEEPDAHTTLLLLTDAPEALPATILSRCQRMDIPLPERALALAWLRGQPSVAQQAEVLLSLARGAPLQALAMAGADIVGQRNEFFQGWRDVLERRVEPTALAEKWLKFPGETLADWMLSWTMDAIRLRSAPGCQTIDNRDLALGLQAVAQQINLKQLFGQLDRLNAARRLLSTQANRQLLLEDLLIRWRHAAPGNPDTHRPHL
ncbi:MAG: DNA polymerase III subunit delta' [Candidatus Methylumidiphilus sp.]